VIIGIAIEIAIEIVARGQRFDSDPDPDFDFDFEELCQPNAASKVDSFAKICRFQAI
jgi:hypothetical protein